MSFTDLKDMGVPELHLLLFDKRKELFELRVRLKTMQSTKTDGVSAIKKDIARILTALSLKRDV